MEMATQPSSTTIESIPDELLWDILLRLPSPASLACAACASPRWRGIASNDSFLKAFRKKHPSSPLLGCFAPNLIFQTSRSVSKSPELAAMLRQADTALASFERDWRIRDCHNGRLLLSGADNQLCIYDPLSQRRVAIGQRTCHDRDHDWGYLDPCLLDGLARQMVTVQQRGQWKKAQESFRVISLQRLRHDSMVRAIEYTLELGWRDHPWAKVQSTDLLSLAMHAAGHIYWVTDCALPLLVLDTGTMEFSQHTLPREMEMDSARCAIGELRDVKGCLVCLLGHHHISSAILDPIVPLPQQPHSNVCLQVWALEKKGEGKEAQICWKLEKEVSVSRILGKDARVYKVNKVVNGLAVIGCNYHALDQYVIDLQSMTVLSKFQYAGEAYPYQMSWPPAVLAAATSVVSSHKRVNLSNEESAQIPSNNRGGREGTSSRGSEPASLQSQLQEESPDVSGSSGIEDASRDIDNQHALASPGIGDAAHADVPTDDEPGGQRKKQKTNACPEVRQANPRATCWNSSMGQPTTQEKPLHKVPFVCHVDGCTESYASKFELNRHLSAHGVEFFCPYCKRDPFKYRHSLNRHVMEVHEQNKRFPCTECDMKFPRSCHLVRHVKALHQSTRSFTCGFSGCSEEFSSRRAKNQHEQSSAHVEPGTKKIKCHFKDCTQTFTERCSCNRHYKSLHERTAPSH